MAHTKKSWFGHKWIPIGHTMGKRTHITMHRCVKCGKSSLRRVN